MNAQIVDIERQGDDLVLTVDLPQSAIRRGDTTSVPHCIIVPVGAIVNRMRDYGLNSQRAALLAIIREHAKRLNALPDGDEEVPVSDRRRPEALRRWGGLRKDVTVSASVGVLTKLIALGLDS